MKSSINQMEIARLSSKGQLVIPRLMRKNLKAGEGTMFAVASYDNMLVLKKIENPLKNEDIKVLRMVEEAWEDIEKGRYRRLSREDFLKELERW